MPYSLATLWHEWNRYKAGVLAVAFSALLIALQFGLLLGLFSITSIPIDHTDAHIWMGAPGVTLVENTSKTLLGNGSQGHIILRAAADAPAADRVPISVLAHVSINFVVKVSYSSPVIHHSVRK